MSSIVWFEIPADNIERAKKFYGDNPTEEERNSFDSAHEGMKQGWSGTFDQLANYLAKV